MKTTIANRILIEDAKHELFWWCEDNLVVKNPDYETLMKLGKEEQARKFKPYLNLYVEKGNDLILPFGVLNSIWNFVNKDEWKLQFNKNKPLSNLEEKITLDLYDYQEEAVQRMVAAKGGILVGGCGSGKTNCGIEILHRLGKRTLWICGKKDLLKQTVNRMKSLYPHIKVGTITEGEVKMDEVTVSTIQTLVKVDPTIYQREFDVVIVDECHHCVSRPDNMRMFGKVVENIPARYKYGLTATPERNDSMTQSMYAILGCNLKGEFAPTWEIARKEIKTLTAEHRKFALSTPLPFCMLNDDGTFNYNNLVEYIANNKERNETIVNNIVDLDKEGRKQLVLCSRVGQCNLLNETLKERGMKSVLLVGKVTAKKRTEILTSQSDWNIIVATQSLAKEGLDVPILDTLHLVSCVGNKTDTVQAAGRIERICEGKKEPIVFDYVDTKIPYFVSRYNKRRGWLKRR